MNTKSAYPSSVVKGIPRLGRKPEGWREVAFGDVLEVVKRPATIDPAQSYQLINVKRNRGGVIPRETKRGSEIKTQTQFYVAADDFVISRRQIVHGACGIVPLELDGALVSNEYATLVPKKGLCLKFLAYFSHTSHFQKTCFHASVGVVIEKMIFNLDDWLKHRLYLPPLGEQKRIVRILAAADRTIARTEDLIATKRKLKEGLDQQLLSGKCRLLDYDSTWTEYHLGALFKERRESNCVGLPLLSVTRKSGVVPHSEANQKDSSAQDKSKYKRIMPGDIGYNTMRMWQGVSALSGLEGIISPAYTVCIPNTRISGSFARHLFKFPPIVHLFHRYSQGLVSDTWSLKFRHFAQIRVRIPSIREQERIAAILHASDCQVQLLEKKLVALIELKRGLMQRLFASSTSQVKSN